MRGAISAISRRENSYSRLPPDYPPSASSRPQLPPLPSAIAAANCSERLRAMTAVEVEETLKRIAGHKGVLGTIIVNKEGVVIRTTFDAERAAKTAGALWSNVARAMSSVRELDPTDAAICIRIRTSKLEYMIVPEAEFGLIVLQQPNSEE